MTLDDYYSAITFFGYVSAGLITYAYVCELTTFKIKRKLKK